MKLKDKFAINTGVGRGISKAMAIALDREGVSLVVAGRTFDEMWKVSKEIDLEGRRCLPKKNRMR